MRNYEEVRKQRKLEALKEVATRDMKRLKNIIDAYILSLEETDIDVEISALLENFLHVIKNFKYSDITIRI